QYLKFGDESTPFGLKWEKDSPESVFYLCEHHGCVIHQSELDQSNGRWICENTGMWTRDGLTFFSASAAALHHVPYLDGVQSVHHLGTDCL
ncbi:hypothetical protein B9L93_005267, partial [Escherichia coli]|nr:hypothetical protein [Escherichia coli]EES0813763.1 hypothetical protein [Escherichia coli]EES8216125.1 hypothetical protein [Escherichia coli]EEY6006096.1 hypothetical protein [Escherichia coli]EFA5697327.1 hypothetical protein [Escherichia coli]